MATLPYDELNRVGQDDAKRRREERRRSIPYNTFFGEMYLGEEEKEKRIEMARALDDVFLYLFALISIYYYSGQTTYDVLYETTERRYIDAISPLLTRLSADIENTVANQVRLIVDTTMKHMGDPYYMSEDRAMLIAENQANIVRNAVNEEDAIAAGFTMKTWVAMRDLHVRPSHRQADGQTVPIMQPFSVGYSQMRWPCDDGMGAPGDEIVGCRCVVEYT